MAISVKSLLAALGLGALLLAPWGPGPRTAPLLAADSSLPSALTVVTAAGGRYRFTVEIAATDRARARGLQGRKDLAPDAGMLFDFGRVAAITMWMKDTFIPLDMIFIDSAGRIVDIERATEPHSLRVIESLVPAKAVLEVRAGTSDRLGIRPGDRVEHAIFR